MGEGGRGGGASMLEGKVVASWGLGAADRRRDNWDVATPHITCILAKLSGRQKGWSTPPPNHCHIVCLCVCEGKLDRQAVQTTHTQKVKVLDHCGLPRQWGEWSVGGLNPWPGPLSGGRGAEGGCLRTIHQLECVSLWQLQLPLQCNEPTNTPSLKGSTWQVNIEP